MPGELLYIGNDGKVHSVSSAEPLPVTGGGGGDGTLLAGEAHVGQVGGTSPLIAVTPALSLTAYSSLDNIGGKLTLTNALRINGGTGVLQSLYLLDRIGQNPALEIVVFDSDPSASAFTDNAAFTITSPDDLKEIGRISIATSDWLTFNTRGRAMKSGIGMVVQASGAQRNLYAAIMLNGSAPTYTAADNLRLKFGFLQD